MKAIFFSALILFAACNTAPDGVVVVGDEARVATLALLDVYEDDSGEFKSRWKPNQPRLEVRKWLYDNNFEYSSFKPDTTLGRVGGDFWEPVYAGFLIYRR